MTVARVPASMPHAHLQCFRRNSYTTAHDPSPDGTAAAQERPALQRIHRLPQSPRDRRWDENTSSPQYRVPIVGGPSVTVAERRQPAPKARALEGGGFYGGAAITI